MSVCGVATGTPTTTTVDFAGFLHGEEVGSADFIDFSLTVDSDLGEAAIFDSQNDNTDDPDLEQPYDGGNLQATPMAPGNLIILQTDADASFSMVDGEKVYDSPDDDADGGTMTFTFDAIMTELGYDWVDLDLGQDETTLLTLRNTQTGESETVTFRDIADDQSSVVWGDHHANTVSPIAPTGFATFDEAEFVFSGSGAIAQIQFTEVPEPATAALVCLGGMVLLRRRRRRR